MGHRMSNDRGSEWRSNGEDSERRSQQVELAVSALRMMLLIGSNRLLGRKKGKIRNTGLPILKIIIYYFKRIVNSKKEAMNSKLLFSFGASFIS